MLIGPKNPGQAPSTVAINVRLAEDDYLRIARLAEADGTSLAGYVRTLIRRHLESLGNVR
jgi:predicted DNA-binding protein